MKFSTLLKRHRLEQGLSFQKLSERSNVDVAYLHRLETGKATRPGRNVVLRIAIGLGLGLYRTEELLITAGHLTLVQVNGPGLGERMSPAEAVGNGTG